MRIVGKYSFKDGEKFVERSYPALLKEITAVIAHVESGRCRTKKSREKTMLGRTLYSPVRLNRAFGEEFAKFGWAHRRVPCEYPMDFYCPEYKPAQLRKGAFREMDFVKDKLGIEVQFGKYAFMVTTWARR